MERRFYLFLAAASLAVVAACVAVAGCVGFDVPVFRGRVVVVARALYMLVPLFAVMFARRAGIGRVARDYRLGLSHSGIGRWLGYSFGTIGVFLAVLMLLTFLCGNLLGISVVGRLATPWSTSAFGTLASAAGPLGVAAMIVVMLLACPVVGGLYAFGGEVAWRGYMDSCGTGSRVPVYVKTGLVWAVWYIPVQFVSIRDGVAGYLSAIAVSLPYFIAMSALLSNAYRASRTLLAPVLIYGFLSACEPLVLLFVDTSGMSSLVGGMYGLLAVAAMVVTNLILYRQPRRRGIKSV